MSKLAVLSSGPGAALGASVAVIAVIGGVAYFGGAFKPERASEALAVPAAQIVPEVVAVPDVEPLLEVKPEAPRFDVVRVETSGAAMIAGRAQAGSTVAIRLNDDVVAEAKADATGNFASFVTLPESADARILTLDVQGGAIGMEQVIIAPIETARVEPVVPVVPVPEPKPGTSEAIQEQPEPEIIAAVEPPKAPLVMLATNEGIRVLQAPDAPKPDAMTALLGSISYDSAGDVALAGRGAGEFVRVYLDNKPVVTSQIGQSGDWQADLPSVDTGIYTLRVDELNAAGAVVTRVETPFKREAADVLEAASQPEKPVQAITVQPGATLWAIAQERYGSGTLYARVVEANADVIRDPDLIYPGQVFSIPD